MRLEDGGGNLLAEKHSSVSRNEQPQDDSGSLAPAFHHKRRLKGDSCAIKKVDQTLNS